MSMVEEIFRSCTAGTLSGELTAKNVSLYYSSPYSIWCEKFADREHREPLGPYRELLLERGIEHEKRVLRTRYPSFAPIPYLNRVGFLHLLEQMAIGADVICGLPMFDLPSNLQGRIDILEKRTDRGSRFGDYHYAVKEIKLAGNIEETHILQAAFYTYLLSASRDTCRRASPSSTGTSSKASVGTEITKKSCTMPYRAHSASSKGWRSLRPHTMRASGPG